MPITTYTELKAAIADWLLRDDMVAVIPTLISSSEAQMSREVDHWRQETRSDGLIDTQYSTLPGDFRSIIRLSVSTPRGPVELAPVSQSEMLHRRQATADVKGSPRFYAISAGSLELFPTPSGTEAVTTIYRAGIPKLSDSVQQNWLLTEAPDLYLYGTLLHSAPYLKDDERIGVWGSLYANALAALNADSEKSKYGGTGLRMRIRGQ